jgi:hypothetical protein
VSHHQTHYATPKRRSLGSVEKFDSCGDRETIDSELRLLAAVRRVCREQDGILPSIGPVDELLDERREL